MLIIFVNATMSQPEERIAVSRERAPRMLCKVLASGLRPLARECAASCDTSNRTRIDRLNHRGYRPGLPLRPELGADALALCRVG